MSIANVGSVTVDVVPDTEHFGRDLKAKLFPEAERIGRDIGRIMRLSIDRGLRDIRIDVNTGEAERRVAELTAELALLGLRNPDIDVDVRVQAAEANIAGLVVEIAGLQAQLAVLAAELAAVGESGSSAFGSIDVAAGAADIAVGLLEASLVVLGAGFVAFIATALIPAVAVLGLLTGGLLAVATAATLGIGAFAAVAISATGGLKDNPVLAQIGAIFTKLTKAIKPQVLLVMQQFVKVLAVAIPLIVPLVLALLPTLGQLATDLAGALGSPAMHAFMAFLQNIAPSAIALLANVLGGLFSGFGSLVAAFGPTGLDILRGLSTFLSGASGVGKSSGFQAFLAYAQANLPGVKKLLGDTFTAVGNLVQTLAPIGPIALKTLDVVVTWISQTFLPALHTALPGIAGFVALYIRYFSFLVEFLLYDVFGPIINGAADAFGWIPNIGDRLRTAQTKFNAFADTVTEALDTAADAAVGVQDSLNNIAGDYDVNIQLSTSGVLPAFLTQPGHLGVDKLIVTRPGPHHRKELPGAATGGLIGGIGTGTSDSNVLRVSRGEFVVNEQATRANLKLLQALNAGGKPGRAGDIFNISGPGVREVADETIRRLDQREALFPVGTG